MSEDLAAFSLLLGVTFGLVALLALVIWAGLEAFAIAGLLGVFGLFAGIAASFLVLTIGVLYYG